jgi:Ser/Thr protein kinase RdoA (MazF antagonist)
MNDNYTKIKKLCEALSIGTLTGEPEHIYWGYSNKMYAVTTTQGKYAVKALNPQLMNLESAILSDKITNIIAERIHAVPAKIFNGKSVHEIDGQLYFVFDWIVGNEVEYDDITPEHSRIMGAVLADIHTTDFSMLNISNETTHLTKLIDWKFYLQKGELCNAVWFDLLKANIDMLYDYYAKGVEASNSLADNNIISHRSLDPRNVIWIGYTPYIVDWDSAAPINPLYDFINTAIHWSVFNSEKDKGRFLAFAHSYNAKNKLPETNWRNVLYKRYLEPLDWLEFSLKRSLKINCTAPEEQQAGTEHAESMVREVISFSEKIDLLENWLSEL